MRVTRIEAEGSPEELRQAGLLDNLFKEARNGGAVETKVLRTAVSASGSLPPDVDELLERRAPRGQLGDLQRVLLTEILGWGDVELILEDSKRGKPRYVRAVRQGSRFGGFIYLWPKPARVTLRLPAMAIKGNGLKFAVARRGKVDSQYGVRVRLRSEEAKAEALTLAKLAYEAVSPDR